MRQVVIQKVTMKLSEIGEEALIAHIVNKHLLPRSAPGLLMGVGDDAAVMSPDEHGLLTLLTTDMLTERMDYLIDMITPYQLGWKSVAVNISDIAAMGGLPTWTFPSIGFRPDTEVSYIDELYRGMIECARRFGSVLAGGDTNSVKGDAVISICQMGKVEEARLALRSSARIGDRILVTGCLGDSLGGLTLLLKYGLDEALRINSRLVDAHYMPMPRVPEARSATETGAIHAMMDLSDGLGADLPKLCRASKVGALVHADSLPVSNDLRNVAKVLGTSATDMAASGGEDFELLMTAETDAVEGIIRTIEGETGTRVTEIGEITAGGVEILYHDGTRKPLTGGWEHFA